MGSRQAEALGYASRGLPVHPCRPGAKVPILDRWPERATTDPATIRRWWSKWPTANVAIATGGEGRLLVLDIDDPAAGEKVRLPPTTVVRTPRGGWHFWFTVPAGHAMPGNSAGKLAPGIDTRGQGGYVLAPPSVVDGRRYRWSKQSGDQIAEAPDWLLAELQATGNGKATDPDEWLALVSSNVPEGQRNAAIAKLAGLLFRFLPPAHAETAAELVACWNAQRCDPPLDPAELLRTLQLDRRS